MKNTYKLLDHTEPLPIGEVERLYKGYWVFIVNVERSEPTETSRGELLGGIPVIIGSVPYDGVEDGIYEKYKAEGYAPSMGMSLLPNRSFISALRFVEENA